MTARNRGEIMNLSYTSLLVWCGFLQLAVPLVAQPNMATTPTGAAGGGVSTAGVYTITGTIGRPDAGRLHSADFTIDGGFWSVVAAIQEPGAPLLSVRFTQTNTVVVSWPVSWPGFGLTEATEATSTTWPSVTIPPQIVVTGQSQAQKQVVVPMPSGKRFYRLKRM